MTAARWNIVGKDLPLAVCAIAVNVSIANNLVTVSHKHGVSQKCQTVGAPESVSNRYGLIGHAVSIGIRQGDDSFVVHIGYVQNAPRVKGEQARTIKVVRREHA